jgi:hypothetical protein
MINRSRLWATGLLLAAFGAGIAVGGAGRAALADRDDGPRREGERRLSYPERLQRDLGLSDEQRTAVEGILARHQEETREIWAGARTRIDTMRTQIRMEIMNTLDDRQRTIFRNMNARHDSVRAARERRDDRR